MPYGILPTYGIGAVWANPWDVFHRARRLEVVAVAGLLWIYFVWFGCGGIFSCLFFPFSLLRTHTHGLLVEATLPQVPVY